MDRAGFACPVRSNTGSPQNQGFCGAGKKKMRSLGTVEAEEEAFQPGEMNGGVYTNELLGIGCTMEDITADIAALFCKLDT